MSEIERLAARMICAGFDGTTVPDDVDALIRRGLGGIVFFSRNVESPQQFADLTADLKSRTDRPLLTSIDQEGGRVQRLREPFTIIPPMRAVGQAGDERLARALGRLMARELRAVNIDMNLAPVLDVDTNPANPVIGARSIGRTPEVVSRIGCAIVRGLQEESVAACGKHFPGHGDTSEDSHHHLPLLPHSLDRLMSVEIPPFRAAVECGISSIMSAHVIFKPIDPKYPATMSQPVLEGLLRRQLGFDGVIVSDAIEMKAIADHFGFEEAIMRGAAAGIDLFMVCHSAQQQNEAIDILVKATEQGQISRKRLEESNLRLDALFERYVKPPLTGVWSSVIGAAEHKAVVDRITDLADPAALAIGHDPTEPG